MKNIIYLFLISSTILFSECFYSCRHDPVIPTTPVCFDSNVLPIILSNCTMAGCHGTTNSESDFILTSYDNIMQSGTVSGGQPKSSSLYNSITTGSDNHMPPGYRLTDDQIKWIYVWILQGANHTTCNSICDSINMTYSGTIQTVINNYCMGCHSSSTPSGNVVLQTYNDLLTIANNGKLQNSVINYTVKPMPPSGQLSTCQIAQLQNWLNNGKKQKK